MERIEYRDVVLKADWPAGEWESEADKIQWEDEETKLPCLIVRGPVGALCGYVGVLPGHTLYGIDSSQCRHGEKCPEKKGDEFYSYCDHRPESLLEAHGGITFAGKCSDTTREKWEKWRACKPRLENEAKTYPRGDSARSLKEWAGCWDNYEAWLERAHARFICHMPAPGEPDGAWWFGFDCAHAGDFSPGMDKLNSLGRPTGWGTFNEYRNIAYVADQCRGLAKQLAAQR